MFIAPRFVAIDDNRAHLDAISAALAAMGTACFNVHFQPETEIPDCLSGVRCLFIDLHLINSVPATDEKTHFANIASIIEARISDANGPYILIIWTAHPQLRKELEEFLNERLNAGRPVAILGLEKEKFLNVASGAVTNATGLRDELIRLMNSAPQLGALLAWETDVLIATGKTLGSLLTLIPEGKRQTTTYAGELDDILSRLACAAVGKNNVEKDPRAALVQALLPILADRISNRWSADGLDIWKAAITKHGDKADNGGDPADKGRINRMMHLAPVGNEAFGPSDWGSVVEYPYAFDDAGVRANFGVSLDELFHEFKIKDEHRPRCSPVMVRIGAVCDVAQRRAGPIPYLFGLKIPEGVQKDKTSPGIWKSPIFTADSNEVFRLQVHSRLLLSVLEDETRNWTAHSRFREQILMELIAAQAEYTSRPGIIRFD
jgi:hypothetical protein